MEKANIQSQADPLHGSKIQKLAALVFQFIKLQSSTSLVLTGLNTTEAWKKKESVL